MISADEDRKDFVIAANPGLYLVHMPTEAMEIHELQEAEDDDDYTLEWLQICPIIGWIIYNSGHGAVMPITPLGRHDDYEGHSAVLCQNGKLVGIGFDGHSEYSSLMDFALSSCRAALETFEELAKSEGVTLEEWSAKAHEEAEISRKAHEEAASKKLKKSLRRVK